MKQNSYIQNILHYFSQLDWDRIYFYLKEEYSYQDTSKDIFLSKVKKIFQKLINEGDTELILLKGECKSDVCDNCGKSGYRFIGNKSRNYIDLIVEASDDDIFDIFYCDDFSTETDSGELKYGHFIIIDEDEQVTFNKTPEYWSKVNSANMAYDEIISKPPKEIDYDGLSYWLEKYIFTDKTIGKYSIFNPKMKWSHFSELYEDLKDFKSYVDLFGNRFQIENTQLEQVKNEDELINWVIGSETLFEKLPFGTNIEQDQGIYYAFNRKIILVGNRLNTVSNFILNHNRHKENLIKKYYSYTKEEEMTIFSRENRIDPQPEIWKLSFHIENRRKSKELSIEIPLFLNELGK